MTNIFKALLFMVAMALAGTAKSQSIPVWKAADLRRAMDTATVPTIFNFWATFCKPCIAELPYFQEGADRYREQGLRLVMVSLDLKEAYAKTLPAFVRRLKLTSPVVFLDETDADLFVPLVDASWSGVIPASLFLYNAKGYRRFVEDELSKEKLEAEIRRMVDAATTAMGGERGEQGLPVTSNQNRFLELYKLHFLSYF